MTQYPSIKIFVYSLGCPKNRVDTEGMLGILAQRGVTPVDSPKQAQILMVNTCGFIEEAREESVDSIIQLIRAKKESAHRQVLVVTGCMVQRYFDDMVSELPEVDLFLGTGGLEAIEQAVNLLEEGSTCLSSLSSQKSWLPENPPPRFLPPGTVSAYIKISDGCSRKCSFCAIPIIKGPMRSRSEESVLFEAEQILDTGVKELVLVGQDTGAYGGKGGLARLISRLEKIKKDFWIRLLYLYPDNIDAELLASFRGSSKLLPYADIPIQHINTRILRAMKRGLGESRIRAALERLCRIPDMSIRTSLITGFPGESLEEFQQLLNFVQEGWFTNLGAFTYSPEEGTAAAKLPDSIPPREKQRRAKAIMKAQKKISLKKNQALKGKTIQVLMEGFSSQHPWVREGRIWSQAPEIDGVCLVELCDSPPGTFVDCQVQKASHYDLVMRPVDAVD